MQGETFWRARIASDAWRGEGGDLERSRLLATMHLRRRDLDKWRAEAKPYSVVELIVRDFEEDASGQLKCHLVRIGGVTNDAELQAISDELKKPVTFKDSMLGEITLNRELDWFEGKAPAPLEGVLLHLRSDGDQPDKACLGDLRELVTEYEKWDSKLKEFAFEVLGEAAQGWAIDGMSDAELLARQSEHGDAVGLVTQGDFLSKMRLAGLSATGEREFNAEFDDGDLFWGHRICVYGNLDKGPLDATI